MRVREMLEKLSRFTDPMGWSVRDELTRLRAENKQLQARVAELEAIDPAAAEAVGDPDES